MKMTTRASTILVLPLALAGTAATGSLLMPAPAEARDAVIYKSPTCGCCRGWAAYLQRSGYHVTVVDHEDMDAVKDGLGVPADMRSCHTAKIGGYVVEGHVPAEAVDKLLDDQPRVIGIAAPGMPSGSPGMDGPKEPNRVYLFTGSEHSPHGTY